MKDLFTPYNLPVLRAYVRVQLYMRAVTKITPYSSSTYQVVLASLQIASPGSSSEALSNLDRSITAMGSNR